MHNELIGRRQQQKNEKKEATVAMATAAESARKKKKKNGLESILFVFFSVAVYDYDSYRDYGRRYHNDVLFFYDSFGFGSACASGGDRSKSIGFFFCWQHRSRQGLDPPSLTSTTLLSVSMADLWKLRICMSRREKMRQKKNEINKKIGSPPHPSHSIHSFAPL